MKVFLDMDGVLADCAGGFMNWHGKSKDDWHGEWELSKLVGKTHQEAWDLPVGFWESLKPLPWMQHLVDLFAGHQLCLLSTPVNAACIEGKIRWIKKHLPAFEKSFLIGPSKHWCAGPDSLLVDDLPSNCIQFVEHGGQAILFPARHNPFHGHENEPMELVCKLFSRIQTSNNQQNASTDSDSVSNV